MKVCELGGGEYMLKKDYYKKYREQNLERLRAYDNLRNHHDPRRVEYRRKYFKQYYEKNREKIKERTGKWKQEHKEQNGAYIQAWRDALFDIWGTTQTVTKKKLKVASHAEHLSRQILLKEGFTSVFKMTKHFPFDYMAKKGKNTYAVEVTTYPRRKISKWLELLLSYLNLQYIIVFIRPTLKDYFLVELNYLQQKSIQVPKEVVLNGGKRT